MRGAVLQARLAGGGRGAAPAEPEACRPPDQGVQPGSVPAQSTPVCCAALGCWSPAIGHAFLVLLLSDPATAVGDSTRLSLLQALHGTLAKTNSQATARFIELQQMKMELLQRQAALSPHASAYSSLVRAPQCLQHCCQALALMPVSGLSQDASLWCSHQNLHSYLPCMGACTPCPSSHTNLSQLPQGSSCPLHSSSCCGMVHCSILTQRCSCPAPC